MTPYHRLARTATYRWWKPLAELAVFAALLVLFWLTVIPALYALLGPGDDGVPGIVKLGLTIAVATPAAVLAARSLGRGWGALWSVEHRLRGRWLATCAVVAVAMLVLSAGLGAAAEALGAPLGPDRGGWVGWDRFGPLALAVVLVIPLQASAEEVVFRGTLLQALGAWVPWRWVPIVVTSIVFALAHGLPLAGFVAIATFGAVAAWLTIRTGGLEAAIALHVVNNTTLFLLDAATGRGDRWVTELNTDVTWPSTLIDVTVNLVYAAVIVRLAARRRGPSRAGP